MNPTDSSLSPAATIDDLVARLESLLDEELEVLRRCDHARLDAVTSAKLEIWQKLAAASQVPAQTGQHLVRLRRKALLNQSLIVHARDTVRGILALAGRQVPSDLPGQPCSFGGGLRLNLRG